jgi:hypothetical protein
MKKDWYLLIDTNEEGPYSRSEVIDLIKKGLISKNDFIKKKEFEAWLPIIKNEGDSIFIFDIKQDQTSKIETKEKIKSNKNNSIIKTIIIIIFAMFMMYSYVWIKNQHAKQSLYNSKYNIIKERKTRNFFEKIKLEIIKIEYLVSKYNKYKIQERLFEINIINAQKITMKTYFPGKPSYKINIMSLKNKTLSKEIIRAFSISKRKGERNILNYFNFSNDDKIEDGYYKIKIKIKKSRTKYYWWVTEETKKLFNAFLLKEEVYIGQISQVEFNKRLESYIELQEEKEKASLIELIDQYQELSLIYTDVKTDIINSISKIKINKIKEKKEVIDYLVLRIKEKYLRILNEKIKENKIKKNNATNNIFLINNLKYIESSLMDLSTLSLEILQKIEKEKMSMNQIQEIEIYINNFFNKKEKAISDKKASVLEHISK